MALVPTGRPTAAPPTAPPPVLSSVLATLGDKKQEIVLFIIAAVFFSVFIFAIIYLVRCYRASLQDEESNVTPVSASPAGRLPPHPLAIPRMVQQRLSSSLSTLVGSSSSGPSSSSSQERPTRGKGSRAPSPLRQHVHSTYTTVNNDEQSVHEIPRIVEDALKFLVASETVCTGAIAPEPDVNDVAEVSAQLEVEAADPANMSVICSGSTRIEALGDEAPQTCTESGSVGIVSPAKNVEGEVGSKRKWLWSDPEIRVNAETADMMVLALRNNATAVHSGRDQVDNVTVEVGTPSTDCNVNPDETQETVLSPTNRVQSLVTSITQSEPAQSFDGVAGSENESFSELPYLSIVDTESFSSQFATTQARHLDLWTAALDRPAPRTEPDANDHGHHLKYAEPMDFNVSHVVTHCSAHSGARPIECIPTSPGIQIERSVSSCVSSILSRNMGKYFEGGEREMPYCSERASDIGTKRSPDLAPKHFLLGSKVRKGIRFAADIKAEVGDLCRISCNVKAGYIKVKATSPVPPNSPTDPLDMFNIQSIGDGKTSSLPSNADNLGSWSSSGPLGDTNPLGVELGTASDDNVVHLSSDDTNVPVVGDDDYTRLFFCAEDHLDDNAERCLSSNRISLSTQALASLITKCANAPLAERGREREENPRVQREPWYSLFAIWDEKRCSLRLDHGASPLDTSLLTPDLGLDQQWATDTEIETDSSSSGSLSSTPSLPGSWNETRPVPPFSIEPSSPRTSMVAACPGNLPAIFDDGGESAMASIPDDPKGLALNVGSPGDDTIVLLPRTLDAPAYDDIDMTPLYRIEDYLDEHADRNFYEYGISYSTQALSNLVSKREEQLRQERMEERKRKEAERAERQLKQLEHELVLRYQKQCRELEGMPLAWVPPPTPTTFGCQYSTVECVTSRNPEPVLTTGDELLQSRGSITSLGSTPPTSSSASCIQSMCEYLFSDANLSIEDRAIKPGRYSRLLQSLQQGYAFGIAAAIAVGFEAIVEDCDVGKVVTFTGDDEFPTSGVLPEEPNLAHICALGALRKNYISRTVSSRQDYRGTISFEKGINITS